MKYTSEHIQPPTQPWSDDLVVHFNTIQKNIVFAVVVVFEFEVLSAPVESCLSQTAEMNFRFSRSIE